MAFFMYGNHPGISERHSSRKREDIDPNASPLERAFFVLDLHGYAVVPEHEHYARAIVFEHASMMNPGRPESKGQAGVVAHSFGTRSTLVDGDVFHLIALVSPTAREEDCMVIEILAPRTAVEDGGVAQAQCATTVSLKKFLTIGEEAPRAFFERERVQTRSTPAARTIQFG